MQTVTIHTRLITNVGGQTEKIQNTFKGTWGIRDNRHLLSYNEADNGGPTHVLFDMVRAELRRMGQVRSRMTFAEHERVDSRYITPHGALPMQIHTHRYQAAMSEMGGRLEVSYALFLAGSHVSDNKLLIEWEVLN